MRSVYWPVVLNVAGIAGAILYGVAGGSGGETTEGVFMTFASTGWLTIFLALGLLIRMFLRKEVAAPDIALLVVVAIGAFFETRLFAFDEMVLRYLFHRMTERALWIRLACRVLLVLQAGLIAFCIYHIVDSYVTPYVSEWLTADAFVRYVIVATLFLGLCMVLTSLVMRSEQPSAWLWLIPIATVTLLPYAALINDAVRSGMQ